MPIPQPTRADSPRASHTAPRRREPSPGSPRPQRLDRMARAFATLFLEVEAGKRPRRLLQRVMCPVLVARLEDAWLRQGEQAGHLRSVHSAFVPPGRLEVVAIVARGSRVGALAFRIRRTADGWRVDDLVRPEDGPLPPPAYPVPQDEPDIFDLVAV